MWSAKVQKAKEILGELPKVTLYFTDGKRQFTQTIDVNGGVTQDFLDNYVKDKIVFLNAADDAFNTIQDGEIVVK